MLMPSDFGVLFKHIQIETLNLNETESVTGDGLLAKIKSSIKLRIFSPP